MIGLPAVAAAKPLRTDRVLLVVGQSLGVPYDYEYVRNAFRRARRKRGDKAPWRFIMAAQWGSAFLSEFCPASEPTFWWLNIDTGERGPALKNALRMIRKAKRKPTDVLCVHGQQEGAAFSAGRLGYSDATFKKRYKIANVRISRILRKAIAGSGWKSVPYYLQPIGTRAGGDTYGDVLVREAQLELIAEHGERLNIRLGAIQPRNLPLRDHVHPDKAGEVELAVRSAHAIGL